MMIYQRKLTMIEPNTKKMVRLPKYLTIREIVRILKRAFNRNTRAYSIFFYSPKPLSDFTTNFVRRVKVMAVADVTIESH